MKKISPFHPSKTGFSALALGIALLGTSFSASAILAGPIQASHVTDIVTDQTNGTWLYEYTVYNDGTAADIGDGMREIPFIRDWELPWFGDEGIDIADVISPTGWAVSIEQEGVVNTTTGWDGRISWKESGDPWNAIFGPDSPYMQVAEVLHWYTNDSTYYIPTIGEGGANFLGGFSFIASYDKAQAPYQASWFNLPSKSGDPALPQGDGGGAAGAGAASPLARGTVTNVPEPATVALLGVGLLGFGLSKGRKDRQQKSS